LTRRTCQQLPRVLRTTMVFATTHLLKERTTARLAPVARFVEPACVRSHGAGGSSGILLSGILMAVVASQVPYYLRLANASVRGLSAQGWKIEWRYLLYDAVDSVPAAWAELGIELNSLPGVTFSAAARGLPGPKRFRPKLQFQQELVEYLRGRHDIRHVWLADSDISFASFELDRYLRLLHCSFSHAGKIGHTPVISQPSISSRFSDERQAFWPFNQDMWRTWLLGTAAIAVPMVEQQERAPCFTRLSPHAADPPSTQHRTTPQRPDAATRSPSAAQAPLLDANFFVWLMHKEPT